jgi:hypothetical protein
MFTLSGNSIKLKKSVISTNPLNGKVVCFCYTANNIGLGTARHVNQGFPTEPFNWELSSVIPSLSLLLI